jgi:hypothetical protein
MCAGLMVVLVCCAGLPKAEALTEGMVGALFFFSLIFSLFPYRFFSLSLFLRFSKVRSWADQISSNLLKFADQGLSHPNISSIYNNLNYTVVCAPLSFALFLSSLFISFFFRFVLSLRST